MKKKLISLLLSSVLLVLPIITANAEEHNSVQDSSTAAVLLDENGDVVETGNLVDIAKKNTNQGYTIQLQQDVDITLTANNSFAIGISFYGSLDLNGYTLTVDGPIPENARLVAGINPMTSGGVKNGTVILDFDNSSSSTESVYVYGVLTLASVNFSDLEIVTAENSSVDAGIGISAGDQPTYSEKISLTNVTVDVGEGKAISSALVQNATAEIVSGSFKNLGSEDEPDLISAPDNQTIIPGVNDEESSSKGVSVYTSDSTTAVIVKDGNAYLYDTLQGAVDAAAKRSTGEGEKQEVTISLLKAPGEGDNTITLPDELKGMNVTINSLTNGEETDPPADYLNGVEIKTSNGEKVEIGEGGVLDITEVESLSVSPTSLTLYSNTTPNTATLTATVEPEGAATVSWSSGNTSIATVDSNGIVTAVGNGTTTITATAGEKSATCTVTVTTYTPPTPSKPTYKPEITESENGSVSTSPTRPEEGDKVTITAEPDEGYKVDTVTVVDKDGDRVTVTNAGSGQYTFTQPKGEVTITVTFTWDNPFTDINDPEQWYYNAVEYVEVNGLMAGLPGGLFAPNKELTRAEAVQILYNLEGQPTVTGNATFTDLTEGEWYQTAIAWAEQNKVIGGYGDGTFHPNDTVTREEFAQMMYNYTVFKKLDTSATSDLTKFPDGENVANWAETAMEWANGNELINGHDDGTLDPQGIAIRAQAASILMRFDLNLVKAE